MVSGTDKVTVIVKGFLPLDPTQFTFEFSGPPGDSVQSGNTTKTLSGVLSAPTGWGFAVSDGFGLIDAFAAFEKLKAGAATTK